MMTRKTLLTSDLNSVLKSVRSLSNVGLSKVVKVAELNQEARQLFEGGLKAKKSPGKRKSPASYLPTHLETAALSIIKSKSTLTEKKNR